jgi:hypothetical protein
MTETLIKTAGCYLGIFDQASAVHRQESLSSIFEGGRVAAERAGNPSLSLFYIAERFVQRARRGEILVWIVLFDGCFKAQIKVLSKDEEFVPEKMHNSKFLADEIHDLDCPTGRVVVTSLHNLGDVNLSPTIEIDPGLYRVGLIQDLEQETKHEFLDQEINYPATDRADWYLSL